MMKIKNYDAGKFVKKNYFAYGVEVNEDRAIPAVIDGLKPVVRRSLWAANKMGLHNNKTNVKTARLVGDVIGKYHPHGDSSVTDAIAKQIHCCVPTFEGEGNWGNFSEKNYAAARYTNIKLSKYSDVVFFDNFYLQVIDLVDNFDGEEKEPVILPALLPHLLLNGASGIGVGMGTEIPQFTLSSVVKTFKEILTSGEITEKQCKHLEFAHPEKAVACKKTNKEQFKAIVTTGKGRIFFEPVMVLKGSMIEMTGFCQNNLAQTIEKVEKNKNVARTFDAISTKDRYGILHIYLKKSLNKDALQDEFDKIKKELSGFTSYNIKVVKRSFQKDKVIRNIADYSVIDILKDWYDNRIILEKKACGLAIEKCNKQISELELKIKAVDHLDDIVKLLKDKKLDDKGMSEKLSKIMKVTVEQAFDVLCMQVRKLRSLEKTDMLAKIKVIESEIKAFNSRIKKPEEYILTTLKDFEKLDKD